jgi:hypothetical protein
MSDQTPQPAQPVPIPRTPVDWPKELIAASLAIAIVGVTLCLLWSMYAKAPEKDKTAWEQRSQVIQVLLALAGTVTGYYFGRIPAERAAASANQAAAANASRANDAIAAKNQTIGQVKDLRTQLLSSGSPLGGGSSGGAAEDVKAAVAMRLEQIVGGA